jgi:glycosyltransferase involved in cell wall biosynthesis
MTLENPKYLLTIGIPTFSRAGLWISLIENLESLLDNSSDPIQIVISDNFSQDNTWEIISNWKNQSKHNEAIVISRQTSNVGPAKNLVDVMTIGEGHFFTFIGDDDRFIVEEFLDLLQVLKNNSSLYAAIHVRELFEDQISNFQQACCYVYEFGNAWMGIIRKEILDESIANDKILERALGTIWPQTVLMFSSTQSISNGDVLLYRKPVGRRTQSSSWESLTKPTSKYYLQSFSGLLVAVMSIGNPQNRSVALEKLAGRLSSVRRSHQRGIVMSPRQKDFGPNCMKLVRELATIEDPAAQFAKRTFLFLSIPYLGFFAYRLQAKISKNLNALAVNLARMIRNLR